MRQRIIDALLLLVGEGSTRPSSTAIAARANIPMRAIFQYFDDFRELYLATADRTVARILSQLAEIAPEQPLEARIELYLDQRVVLCEAIAPFSRTAMLNDPDNADVGRRMNAGRFYSRNLVERVFASELARLSDADHATVVDMLLMAGDWETWNRLRHQEGMDPMRARSIIERLVRAALHDALSIRGSQAMKHAGKALH